jgi:hypothetical protein
MQQRLEENRHPHEQLKLGPIGRGEPVVYQSVNDLLTWSRIIRREAGDLLMRYRMAEPNQPLKTVLLPGAELLCPTCSGEARPDEADTATCGTCGTLSPLDSTVAFSNTVHQTLHSGIRVRHAIHQGAGGEVVPEVTAPFPMLVLRVGSLITLSAIDGQRRNQLDALLRNNRDTIRRWAQKEADEGATRLAKAALTENDGVEAAHAALDAYFGPLEEGFPVEDNIPHTLEQVFHCAAQYHKMRTSSIYATLFAEHAASRLRVQLGLTVDEPLPWRNTSPFARSLHPNVRAEQRKRRYRASEEALTRAVTHHLQENLTLLGSTLSRHRAMTTMAAETAKV